MPHRLAAVFALVTILLLGAGCQGVGGLRDQDRASRLHDAVRLYVQAVRWRRGEVVAGLLRPRAEGAPPVDLSVLDRLQVTNADYRLGAFAAEDGEAAVEVTFEFTYGDSVRVRRLARRSVWWLDEETGQWFLDGGLPDFSR